MSSDREPEIGSSPLRQPHELSTQLDSVVERPSTGDRVYLVVRQAGQARVLDLAEGDRVTLGRSPEATIVVADARVSRLHTEIVRRDGSVFVIDLGSRNGTRLGERVLRSSERRAEAGEVVAVGDSEVVIAMTTLAGAPRSVRGRLEYELLRIAEGGQRSATLVRIAIDSAAGPADLAPMTETLAGMALVEGHGPGETIALLLGNDVEDVRRTVERLERAAPGTKITTARFPEDGTTAETLLRAARGAPAPSDAAPRRPEEGDDVIVADDAMVRVFEVVRRLAQTPTTVLVLGETGVGKGIVAERIHRHSPRGDAPFVRLNCASLPETLLESELFGHEKGAFTGADRRKIGYLEAANRGTLLLDEIGELPLSAQVKLLRVLEVQRLVRLGGTQEIPLDVRVICATHRDLESEVAAGRFRQDLYFRISAFAIRVPPLRDRPSEIVLLAQLFARRIAKRMQAAVPVIDPLAMAALANHGWPGNIRELRNAIEHATVLADNPVIRLDHLPESIGRGSKAAAPQKDPVAGGASAAMRKRVADIERKSIEDALTSAGGNRTRAAELLGISRGSLIYKITESGLDD